MKDQITDILIIGAGPSGMVAAGYLSQKDVSIKVIEKQKFPRFSIGESLIPRCMDNFEEAGLLNPLQEKGFQKKYGARFIKDKQEALFDFSEKYGEGWNWTWQVPRADFDKTLTDHLSSKGVEIRFETRLKSVERQDGIWKVKIADAQNNTKDILAKFIIDSSGNGRVLAGQLGLEAPARIEGHSSIFTHINERHRPDGIEGTQISFELLDTETWFWYIPFSNGISSLGFVGPDKEFKTLGITSETVFWNLLQKTRHYKGRFDNYNYEFDPINLRNISKNVSAIHGEGFALTGNSAEFLDPVFSSGVAFATESALLAAKLAYKELKGEEIDWNMEYEVYIKQGVEVFSTYVKEWYSGRLQDIIFHPNPDKQIKKQICAVLAGYVWDKTNPFVRNHTRIIESLHRLILSEKK